MIKEKIDMNELLDFIDGKLSPQQNLVIQQYVAANPIYLAIMNGLVLQKAQFSNTTAFKQHLEKQKNQTRKKLLQRLKS